MRPARTDDLIRQIAELDIIDCHEHLPPEKTCLETPTDACVLFGHYCRTDLITAGMAPSDYDRMLDRSLPLDYRWGLLAPHIANIRHGSYARSAFIAARELYGFEDIDSGNYLAITEAMRANHTPGIYQRVMGDRCRIRLALTQHGRTDYADDSLLVPLMPATDYTDVNSWDAVQNRARSLSMTADTLDQYMDVMAAGVAKWTAEGCVGLKTVANPECGEPNRAEAARAFAGLRDGAEGSLRTPNPLRDYLRDRMLTICAEQDLTVAVHAGMWGDFRDLDSGHIIKPVQRHPKTRFDLYHLGMPAPRQTLVIGKNSANVWLNLCWCHIVSPAMTRSALHELIDLVPVNKVFGFGGDYHAPVEKVVGHLRIAQENIAWVLAERIDAGLMTEPQALDIAAKWLWHNPVECYKLSV